MDKNMINIDDLVRMRLKDADEKARPGAWLAMRDLLDAQMPVVAAAAFNWKRAMSVAALVLFVGAASLGGYKLYTNNKGGAAGTNNAGIASTSSSDNGGQSSGGGIVNSSGTGNPNSNTNTVGTIATDNNESQKQGNSLVKSFANISASKSFENQSTTSNYGSEKATEGGGSSSNILTAGSQKAANNKSGLPNRDNALNNRVKNHSNNTFASANKLPKHTPNKTSGTVAGGANNQGNAKKVNIASGSAPANPVTQPVTPPVYSSTGGSTTPATVPTAKRTPLDYRKTNPRYVDSADYTYVHEKTRRGMRKTDTIDKGVLVFSHGETPVASANTSKGETGVAELVPAAPVASNTPSEHNKRESFASRRGAATQSLWEKMIENTKPDFSRVSFYPGLVGGINSTVGKYNMMGIQGGVAGVLNFNERWGILAELKALYRFGNGKSFTNDYSEVQRDYQKILPGTGLYEYKIDSTTHAFNIASTGLVELPLALKYSAEKLNFFAGTNFAYNWAVNVEEKFGAVYTRSHTGDAGERARLNEKFSKEHDPKLTTNEFGARMSMGYMFGIGYQVTPLVGLDLRMSQVFWDQGKTRSRGMYFVSKEMYRAPCFQFNVTYKLQSNKNKQMPKYVH